ncbi:MAG: hypothetical protein HYW07_09465 [Candidatus Latescibacteria bacterium]|nr:hypothetical protein [Candidatus Latescibacterota bacterium]
MSRPSMTPRERVCAVLDGQVPDRVPFQDAYWQSTLQRWRGEGLPDTPGPADYFGFEIARLGGDYTLQLPVRQLEDNPRYRLYVDANGATRREMATGDDWTPQWLDFQIKGREDWQRLKERAEYNPERIPLGALDAYRAERARGRFICYSVHACFHPTWQKIGMETLLMWMLDDPELIAEMFAAHTRLILGLYDALKGLGLEFDGAWLSDDLGYRSAPLISPQLYRDLVFPYHQQMCAHFARDDLKTILHSDGNVGPLIPHFLDAGFSALHPLEAKAGLDVRQLKAHYGKALTLFGNIDVRQLAAGPEEAAEEVRLKVEAAKPGGGYLFHSDHSVPSDVPLANYRAALAALERYGRYD